MNSFISLENEYLKIEIDVSEDGENGSHAVYDKPAPVSGI